MEPRQPGSHQNTERSARKLAGQKPECEAGNPRQQRQTRQNLRVQTPFRLHGLFMENLARVLSMRFSGAFGWGSCPEPVA
jgi:hypothetical protein